MSKIKDIHAPTAIRTRIGEIDALRGIAVISMIFYHFGYDLVIFYHFPFSLTHPCMRILAQAAPIFFCLAGISSYFSRNQQKRILRLFLVALLVSLGTYWQNPDYYVRFGTLHFLTLAMVITLPMKKLSSPVLILLLLASVGIGILVKSQVVSNPWLFPFGLTTLSFRSSDYYPLFPYLAYPILGLLLGRWFYPTKKSLFPHLKLPFLEWIGRNSLPIYILHQPILLGILQTLSHFSILP